MQKKTLGLIAGNGKFPIIFSHKAKEMNYKIVAAAIVGDTSYFLKFLVDKIAWFNVGDLKKLFDFLKENEVSDVIMAGQINPNNLFDKNLVFDDEFKGIFDAIKNRKADTIFNAIAGKLSENEMELVDSTFLVKDNLAPKGTLTKRGPTVDELEDIDFGRSIAKEMGKIDVGQTVVVKDKAIVAIEAMEGTDKTILRGGNIAREGAVVVKMSKPNQDMRFDVPVVGPRTIKYMIKSNAKCLAIESGKTILIDRDICVKHANKTGISIVSV